MKTDRILTIIVIFCAILLTGCSKEKDQPTEQDFFVNVYYTYSDHEGYGRKVATPSAVMIFKDNGKAIDTSNIDTFNLQLYDIEGNALELKSASTSTSGINTFESIPNGKYIIMAVYYPYNFVRYSSYKKINVDYSYRATTEEIIFDCSKDSGYQEWE